MTFYESPELRRLFAVYSDSKTPGRASIADHLSALVMREHESDPFLVATATDLAVYPGDGAPPQVRGFRLNIPGFTELTAVSHLGPALGAIVAIAQRGDPRLWRDDAERLIADADAVRSSNSIALWRDALHIGAFAGREPAITAMVDYACDLASGYLRRALDEPGYLSPQSLRRDYLDVDTARYPVSGNKIMVATFGLYALDHAHGLIRWFEDLSLDWPRLIFVITGRQGRPTAGTTKSTTNLVRIMKHISRDSLRLDRIFLAPTMPGFEPVRDGDLTGAAAAEAGIRWNTARIMSSVELAPLMYEGYPTFAEPPLLGGELVAGAAEVSEFPPVRSADDWFTMITRLRLTLEDPRQLLAAGVTDYITERLVAVGNDPRAVVIPGLDTESYPGFRDDPPSGVDKVRAR